MYALNAVYIHKIMNEEYNLLAVWGYTLYTFL